MTIDTGDAIGKFKGQENLDSTSASVSDGGFSIAGDSTTITNTEDVTMGNFILESAYSGAAPDANSRVSLFLQALDIVSTNDAEFPDANNLSAWIGDFGLNDVTSTQFSQPIDVALPNSKTSQIYQPVVQNNGGQTLDAGWILYFNGKAIGPKA